MKKLTTAEKMSEVYWQSVEAAPTISQLNPEIAGVRIRAIPMLHGKVFEEFGIDTTFCPDHKYRYRVKCPNGDCDSGYIELSDEIWSAVKSGKVVEGRKGCSGHSKKYAHNRRRMYNCEAYVEYRIEPARK